MLRKSNKFDANLQIPKIADDLMLIIRMWFSVLLLFLQYAYTYSTSTLECSPSLYPYTVEIVYRSEAATQSLQIYEMRNYSLAFVTSMFGYQKDYRVDTELICVDKLIYQIICSSTLADSWNQKSFFTIKAFGKTAVLRGTVDVGKVSMYYMHPFNPITPWSRWRFTDYEVRHTWIEEDYDDSLWAIGKEGSFLPILWERFYRTSFTLPSSAFTEFSSFEFYFYHLFSIEVFINGIHFLTDKATALSTTPFETVKREALDRFFHSSTVTIAVHLFSPMSRDHDNVTTDPFTAHLVFLSLETPTSEAFKAHSEHGKDFYAHPLSDAFDASRKTEWWFKGHQADVLIDYKNPLGEFVNEYSIVSSSQEITADISSWELYGSNNNVDFDLLDIRWNVKFMYRRQRLTFPLNNNPKNYRFFKFKLLDNRGNCDRTTVSEIRLFSTGVVSRTELTYPSLIVNYFQFEEVYVAPLSSGFSHFSLLTPLPSSLYLHPASGILWGQLVEPLEPTNVTIVGENMQDHSKSMATFVLEGRGCDRDHSIVLIEKTNFPFSNIECWNLTSGSFSVEDCGYAAYSSSSTQRKYYCLPKQPFHLTSFLSWTSVFTLRQCQSQNPGLLTVRLPYPEYSDRSLYPLVQDLSFESVCELSSSDSALINPVRAIDERTEWTRQSDEGCEYGWQQPDYDDTQWQKYSPMAPYVTRVGRLMCWRSWVWVGNTSQVTSVEMKVRHASKVTVWVNGDLAVESASATDRTWMTITFQSHALKEGRNLVAVALGEMYWRNLYRYDESHDDQGNCGNHLDHLENHDNHENSGRLDNHENADNCTDSVPNRYFLFRCVFRLTTELYSCARAMDLSVSGDSVSGYDASNLISKNTADFWKANFNYGKASVTFSMKYNSKHVINKYCATSSLDSSYYDPVSWRLWFQINNNWVQVSTQTQVTWTSRLQTQCFVIPCQRSYVSAVLWRIDSVNWQRQVEASRFTFYSLNTEIYANVTLRYDSEKIEAFLNVPIVTACPKYPYFDGFSVEPKLPRGLLINTGTGCITGSVSESFAPVDLTITAVDLNNETKRVKIPLSFKQCEWPSQTLQISLQPDETPKSEMELMISLFNSEWTLVRTSQLGVSSEVRFTHCLPVDMFRVMMVDPSYQGDLHSQFTILLDNRIIKQGRVNPGFPQIWTNLVVSDNWKDSVPWYYFFDGAPPSDWFKRIEPAWETWDTAVPGEFPKYSGIAQYFKTVMVLPIVTSYTVLNVFLTIPAGFVLYLNGKEIHRWNLPDGFLTSETPALACYDNDIEYKIAIPLQFSQLVKGTNVVAVELHEMEKPRESKECTFRMGVSFGMGVPAALIGAEVIDMSEVYAGSAGIVKELTDGNYYSVFKKHKSDRFVSIHFFSENGALEYVSQFHFYLGDLPGSFPPDIALYGRTLKSAKEMELAKSGRFVESREWVKLLEVTDIEVFSPGLGKFREFQFYNEYSFNEFRMEFKNFEIEAGLEIAEIEFWSEKIRGFCDIREIGGISDIPDFTNFIPSYNWYLSPCPKLYSGSIDYYCYEGNWTNVRNLCRCNAPVMFRYPVSVWYIKQRQHVSISPVVKGAEVMFFALAPLPMGLHLNETTGEIAGEVNGVLPLVVVQIEVVNLEGSLVASLGIMTVNNYEMMLVMIAVLMVVLLVLLLLMITRLLHRKTKVETRGDAKLNVELIPDSLRSLLL